ncbi:methyltransferase domain-containing protein [Singulisphaera sp. Ch08]|uniref:Methyltransferase domain-containing protein n=1 Tax=Singulisphaera sp. Ch08 TaxID=3120278 RepID=A0AAU7C7T0_9BACT
MTPQQTSDSSSQIYDNNGQYTRKGILRYERIFGEGYISTGGHETTLYLCSKLEGRLLPGARVLDVGCGIGGAMFYLAKDYGSKVTGIDLAPMMITIAQERAAELKDGTNATFLLGDIMEIPANETFDIIWSRDALMHIADKKGLFSRLYDLLEPGGKLVITDYAKGLGAGSPEFQAYVASTGYDLHDPASYGKLLEAAGFVDVVVEDATDKFLDIMKRESDRLAANPESFVKEFSEQDLNYLRDRWAMKDGFCKAGDMKWGIFQASKSR